MSETLRSPANVQTPLTIVKKGANAGNWKFFFEARFDYEPSDEDIYAASKSINYGCIMRREGGYILNITSKDKVTDSEHEEENGLWLAKWTAILD